MTLPVRPPPVAVPSDPRWVRYAETILRFHAPPLSIDLRRPLAAGDRERIEALGLGGSFGVWTAENPFGEALDASANRGLRERLEGELAARGVPWRRVTAQAGEGHHCEECVAAAIGMAATREMAAGLGQMAFFWFETDRFMLVGALVEAEPILLPLVPVPEA